LVHDGILKVAYNPYITGVINNPLYTTYMTRVQLVTGSSFTTLPPAGGTVVETSPSLVDTLQAFGERLIVDHWDEFGVAYSPSNLTTLGLSRDHHICF